MTRDELKTWIIEDEGFKQVPYYDSVGKVTIGVGRNLSDNGLSADEVYMLFENDMNRVEKELSKYSWYNDSPESVKNALFNMCFNIGIDRLLGFKDMIKALEQKDYYTAAIEAVDSKWARQVGKRAHEIAIKLSEGSQSAKTGTNISD